MASLKSLTFNGVKWYLLGDGANIIANFFIGLVLARLLTPNDYGTVGVYGIFFALANIFINGGFSMSLIQKKDLTEIDCSTAFWSNVVAGAIMYLLFFFAAPYISLFFKLPILTDLIRFSAIGFIIGSFTIVQTTLFNKQVNFKITSQIRFISNVLAGVGCIILAYNNFGVWSLVIQGFSNLTISTILLWIFSKWRPTFVFSWKSFKEMFSFGGRILGTRLLEALSGQSTSFVLGKGFSPSDLGYYEKGAAYARLISNCVSNALFGVAFPVLSKVDDDDSLKQIYRKYLKISSMAIFFMMLLLFALGKQIIVFLYTPKWEFSAILMQIIIWALMFNHVIAINNTIYNVKGKGNVLLKLQTFRTIIQLSLLIAMIPLGIYAVCFAEVIYFQIAMILYARETKKIIGYGYFEQWKDIGPYLIMSIIAIIPAFLLGISDYSNFIVILCGGFCSLILYISILYVKRDSVFIQYIWDNPKIKNLRNIVKIA